MASTQGGSMQGMDMRMHKTMAGIVLLALFVPFIPSLSSAQSTSTNDACPSFKVDFGIGRRDGATGTIVTQLQTFLARDASIYPEGLVTGYYGNLTKKAVQRFQALKGIPATGFVGPLTREAIRRACTSLSLPSQPATLSPVSFVVTPLTGAPPLRVAFQMNFGNRPCNEEYVIDFGNGQVQNSKSGTSAFPTCGAVTISHTYTTLGSYTARLDKVNLVSGVASRQTLASANVSVTENAQTSTAASITITAPEGGTSVKRGSTLPISWVSQNAPAGSKVRLEVYPLNATVIQGNNDNGVGSAFVTTGSYNWTIPTPKKQILADSGIISGLPNGQYRIHAKLYTGDSCWGFCVVSTPHTILASAQGGIFTISGGVVATPGTPLSTFFSVSPTSGNTPLTVNFSTKFPPSRDTNPMYYIDFDDASAEWVADCTEEPVGTCTNTGVNTHVFSDAGTFDVWLVMRTFDESCAGESDCAFIDKTISRQSVSVGGGFGSDAGVSGACVLDGVGYGINPDAQCSITRQAATVNDKCANVSPGGLMCTVNGWIGAAIYNHTGVKVACMSKNGVFVPAGRAVKGNSCDENGNDYPNCEHYYICRSSGWWDSDSYGNILQKRSTAPWIYLEWASMSQFGGGGGGIDAGSPSDSPGSSGDGSGW